MVVKTSFYDFLRESKSHKSVTTSWVVIRRPKKKTTTRKSKGRGAFWR